MKKVSLLLAFAVISFSSFAQLNRPYVENVESPKEKISANDFKKSVNTTTNRSLNAPGDVIYSEDFSSGVPTGWTLVDDAGVGGWIFIDSDTAYTGAYTNALNAVVEGTPGGYLHLPADYYNTVPGLWPREMVASPVDVDATIRTAWIPVSTTNINLSMALWLRHYYGTFDINVKDDVDDTWFTLNGLMLNGVEIPNGEYPPYPGMLAVNPIFDLSANLNPAATQIQIEFRVHSTSHYFYSIDDIQLSEKLDNDIAIVDYFATSGGVYTSSFSEYYKVYNTNYSEIPANLNTEIQFGALVHQNGTNGVNARVEFTVDSVALGSGFWSETSDVIPNFGTDVQMDTVLVHQTSTPPMYSPSLDYTHFHSNGFITDGIPYQVAYKAKTDNFDQVEGNDSNIYNFSQTHGRFSFHRNPTWNDDPDLDNDDTQGEFQLITPNPLPDNKFASNFYFQTDGTAPFSIEGIRFYVANDEHITFDAADEGILYSPILFFYDATAGADGTGDWVEITTMDDTETDLIFVGDEPFILTPADTANWVYMDIDPGTYTFAEGDYLVGMRIVNYNSQEFMISLDDSDRQGGALYQYHDGPSGVKWYSYINVIKNPMIDAYTTQEQFDWDVEESLGNHVGTEEVLTSNNKVKVYPNPTTGIIKLENVENATISVYSLTGNLVQSIESNAVYASFNLNGLAKGTYLVKVVKENEVITKKINLLK